MAEISIIIPIYNEEKYIAKCLDSIIESEYDKNEMEVLLIDGGSTDKTIAIIKQYQKKYPFFKLLHNPKKIVPVAMNIGIKNARGEYIIRLDAHSMYPKDYFKKLIYYHKKLDADNVGGVIVTDVKNKNYISNAIKNVLSDRLGVGSAFRSGVSEIKEVDTVPFGLSQIFDIPFNLFFGKFGFGDFYGNLLGVFDFKLGGNFEFNNDNHFRGFFVEFYVG
jgi:glycosyltransferase involved in cell wall biosynthesis